MAQISGKSDLDKAIATLKNAEKLEEGNLRQRFRGTKAILATAWTLFPWSAAKKHKRQLPVTPAQCGPSIKYGIC